MATNLKPDNGFQKNPDNINRNGRPKKLVNVIKDVFMDEFQTQLSTSQANELIMSMLTMTRTQIKQLGERDDVPFWMTMISKKMERDIRKGSVHLMELLFDRVFGKPKETIDTINTSIEPNIQIDVVQSPIPLSSDETQIIE